MTTTTNKNNMDILKKFSSNENISSSELEVILKFLLIEGKLYQFR